MTLLTIQEAKDKLGIPNLLIQSIRNNFYSLEDLKEASEKSGVHFPQKNEELSAFMHHLFMQLFKKKLNNLSIRMNEKKLSIRFDDNLLQNYDECIEHSKDGDLLNYLSEKNSAIYDVLRSIYHFSNRKGIERMTYQGREFLHVDISLITLDRLNLYRDYISILSSFTASLSQIQNISETLNVLIKERNEERLKEYIQQRTLIHAEYIEKVMNKITIPLDVLTAYLRRTAPPEKVEAFKKQMEDNNQLLFYKKPRLNDLFFTGISYDVFSAPSEEDETWMIKPIIPDMDEVGPDLIYQGQGVLTSINTEEETLRYVIQDCLRTKANLEVITTLPEDILTSIEESSNRLKEFFDDNLIDSLSSLDFEHQKKVYIPTAEIRNSIQESFSKRTVKKAIRKVQSEQVNSLTASILKQIEEARTPIPLDHTDPFEDTEESLSDAPAEAPEVQPVEEYHSFYGQRALFKYGEDYVAFRQGNTPRLFSSPLQAAIYLGLPVGTHPVYNFNDKSFPGEAIEQYAFTGQLF